MKNMLFLPNCAALLIVLLVGHLGSACLSPASAAPAEANEYIVIAQLNLWYYGPGMYGGFEAWDGSGLRNTNLVPALGYTYHSSDQRVIRQQIEWAAEYGIDAFSIEWTTPREVPGSLEENLDDAFLKAENLHKIRWCIFYDFNLRLTQTPGLNVDLYSGVDFNDPAVAKLFIGDMVHFAEKYFSQPQYLKIDQRPVVYIWSTWNFIGDLAGAVQTARNQVALAGYDVFIVADEIRDDKFDPTHAALFDAHSTFTFLVPGMAQTWSNVEEAALAMDGVFSRWRGNIEGLKVTGRNELINFQPGWAPQYDDRAFNAANNLPNPIYVPAESVSQVKTMAETARNHAQPVGSQGQKFIWVNTFNNWPETTTIEPTAVHGPKYPAGNYQFDMLEVVREVFGPETFQQ